MSSSNSSTLRNLVGDLSHIEANLINIYWNTYSINLGFNDIFTDRYDTEDGVDKLHSTYTYDTVNHCIAMPQLTSLILSTVSWSASEINPNSAYCVIEIDTQVVVQLGVDITFQISTDGGTHYSIISPLSVLKTIGTIKYIRGYITGLISYGSDQIKTKITCLQTKNIKIRALATGVRYLA